MVVPISSTARQPHALNRTHHSDIGLAAAVTLFGPKDGIDPGHSLFECQIQQPHQDAVLQCELPTVPLALGI